MEWKIYSACGLFREAVADLEKRKMCRSNEIKADINAGKECLC